MYAEYWGLTESPFHNVVDPRWFYEGPAQEEALARLFFLVENGRRFGLLAGEAGTGKSLLLNIVSRQVERSQRELAFIDLAGLNRQELLHKLVSELRISSLPGNAPCSLWRTIEDHLSGLRSARRPTVVLLDHLHDFDDDVERVLRRLYHLDGRDGGWLTILVAIRVYDAIRNPPPLAELADLRVELPPFDRHETGEYVLTLLERAGCTRRVFDPSAIEALFDLTRGVPRDINRLCDLSLLAAMGEGRRSVDAEVVSAAAAELQPATAGALSRLARCASPL